MKALVLMALAASVMTGCATSTVTSRKEERHAAYEGLPAEVRSAVDLGHVRVGMNTDAVYMAWGPPSQIVAGGNEAGETVTWLYFGSYLRGRRNWDRRLVYYEYYPANYVRAEVAFVNGVVSQWQTFAEPPW